MLIFHLKYITHVLHVKHIALPDLDIYDKPGCQFQKGTAWASLHFLFEYLRMPLIAIKSAK